jgi:hypothetical protein
VLAVGWSQRAVRTHLGGLSQTPLIQPGLQHAVLNENQICEQQTEVVCM